MKPGHLAEVTRSSYSVSEADGKPGGGSLEVEREKKVGAWGSMREHDGELGGPWRGAKAVRGWWL